MATAFLWLLCCVQGWTSPHSDDGARIFVIVDLSASSRKNNAADDEPETSSRVAVLRGCVANEQDRQLYTAALEREGFKVVVHTR